jgi:16S rRNA G1207 methylase RsmC
MTSSLTLSPFIVNHQSLILERDVQAKVHNLQAWDAADEYLLSYLQPQLQPQSHIAIFNDGFGALALNLLDHHITSISDSFVSHQCTLHNAKINQLPIENLTLKTSVDELPQRADVIVLKIPKSNQMLQYQLAQISQLADEKTLIIAAARAKDIHSSTLALFERYLGETTTSLALKKARLVFSQKQKTTELPALKTWKIERPTLTIHNFANVFSSDKLDIGARFFMQHLPQLQPNQHVIDLACGNGVIGLTALSQQPDITLQFIDESAMAIASAQLNVEHNFPQQLTQCQFKQTNCLLGVEEQSADIVLCNPPFHQQHAITDHIAWQMFKDSLRVLKKGGELRIIGNRQLGYHVKLKRLFGHCEQIAANRKFVILSVKKQ